MDAQLHHDSVVNLSDKELTPDQVTVLSKGLSFVPTCNEKPFDVKVDLFRFFRKIKLKHFFGSNVTFEEQENVVRHTSFKPKSHFCPNVTNPSIQMFCRLVEQDAVKLYEKPYITQSNLNKAQRLALNELTSDHDLVIKPADKGGAVVVQQASKYRLEIVRQLGNINFYRKLHSDPTESFQKEIKTYLTTAKENKCISKAEFDYLSCMHPIRPVFILCLNCTNKSLILLADQWWHRFALF